MTSRDRQLWMRREAIMTLELTKGFVPEQRAGNNALTTMETMADFVIELTADADKPTRNEQHEASLAALHKYFDETPQEEIDKLIREVEESTAGMQGPTVDEYFEGLNPVLQNYKGYQEGLKAFFDKTQEMFLFNQLYKDTLTKIYEDLKCF